jgi:tetratricopeptide (TPR) repeat protein
VECAVLAVVGCGETAPEPKHPVAVTPPPFASAASTDAAVQVGLAPAPTAQAMPPEAEEAYSRGFQAWVAGDLAGAKKGFSDAVARAPRAVAPQYSLGCVLERLGDTQGALDAYRKAADVSPAFDVALAAYALLLARTGHAEEAERTLAKSQSSAGSSPRLLTVRAEIKSMLGDSPGCQQLAQEALARQPDSKDAMVVVARDFYRSHHWDLARYALQAILDGTPDGAIPPRDPSNSEALLLRALIERDTPGQRKQAIRDFEAAAARRPDMVEAFVNLGEMKLEAGNAGEAVEPLERSVKYAPDLAVAHLDLGDCYRLLGRVAEAKRELDQAASLDSTLAGVHYDFGLLYLFSQNVPGASTQDDQLTKAIAELETYRSMRTAKVPKGQGGGEDVDELLSTAKRKQSELRMKSAPVTDSTPAPSASGSANSVPPAPSASGMTNSPPPAPSAPGSANSPPAPPGATVPFREMK